MADRFKLYAGNYLEDLAGKLAELLLDPPEDPLAPETVAVQNRGAAIFLQQQLSRRLGICANLGFPFLNSLVEEIMKLCLPPELTDDLDYFRRETLQFAIYGELSRPEAEFDYPEFGHYIAGGSGPERTRQLAAVLARTFDQYEIFRPEMMLSGGPENPAQRRLWRRLTAGRTSRAGLFKAFFELRKAPALRRRFPRLQVFGVSSMPPLYLWFFQKLSEFVEVNFFYLNFCREEWSFALAPGRRRRPLEHLTSPETDGLDDPDGFREDFNPLLSSFGQLGREFFAAVLEYTDYGQYDDRLLFRDPAAARQTMLSLLQQDILDGINCREARPVGPGDHSIKIASCHQPGREVEILQDELLRRFQQDPALQSGEIIVMMPDIELYAPYIQAVFGTVPPDDPRHIPFSLADYASAEAAAVFHGFFSLYRTAAGRFTAAEVLDLLDNPFIREKFRFSAAEFDRLPQLLQECGTAWGIDAGHRAEILRREAQEAIPVFSENSWRETRDRLLLGFAMEVPPDRKPPLFHGLLPAGSRQTERAAAAIKLEIFLDRLVRLKTELAVPRRAAEWRWKLPEILNDFLAETAENRPALQRLREESAAVAAAAELADAARNYDAALLFAALENRLAGAAGAAGFLRGGVTFCNLQPMRSIPHKLVCLLGLDEHQFPRRDERSNLDLIWQHPRRGDRSARLEDRYLFLEAILAAREGLYLSYVGQSPDSGEELPPSPLLAEVLGYLRQAFRFDGDDPAPWLVRHPLHSFHPDYFRPGGKLFSYSPDNFAAAGRLLETESDEYAFWPPDFEIPAAEAEEEAEEPDAPELARFFRHPFRYFCRTVLQMTDSPDDCPEIDDLEPLEPDVLERWHCRRELLASLIDGDDPEEVRERVRAAGKLPAAPFGRFFFEELLGEANELLDRPREELRGESLRQFFAAAEFQLPPGDRRPDGILAAGRKNGVLAALTAGRIDGRAAVAGRLLQTSAAAESESGRTDCGILVFGSDGRALAFPALLSFQLERQRRGLLELYRTGRRKPLKFLPRTSWELFCGRDHRNVWQGNAFSSGEYNDFAVRLFAPPDLENELSEWRRNAAAFFGESEASDE